MLPVSGLLIGLLLRYTNIGVIESQTIDVIQKNTSVVREPPDYLRLEVSCEPLKIISEFYNYFCKYKCLQGQIWVYVWYELYLSSCHVVIFHQRMVVQWRAVQMKFLVILHI